MLKRELYVPYISDKLQVLTSTIQTNGKLNLLSLNVHAEIFFKGLLNKIYGANYSSTNDTTANEEAIDLKDETNKIVLQVTSQKTKSKIENTLSKSTLNTLATEGYSLKFLFIDNDAKYFRTQTYSNPGKIKFVPTTDLLDITELTRAIYSLDIDKLVDLYVFVCREFGETPSHSVTNRNLTQLLNILAKQDLSNSSSNIKLNSYSIDDKIDFNSLGAIKDTTIKQNSEYMGFLQRIYQSFDEQGMNKTVSIFSKLSSFYEQELLNESLFNVQRFFNIIDKTTDYIRLSDNYVVIPDEELELCVRIIIVDAFIRCKIFKNPKGYDYVTSD